ncbi:MAG: A24 family peptidase C-terminal domain-containing protein [Candidatus Baldrarchaeia archaeon]
MDPQALETISLGLCFLFLTWASIQDIKKREVHDLTWILMTPPGVILAYLRYSSEMTIFQFLMMEALAVALIGLLMVILVLLKTIGSADALAFIAIALYFPRVPSISLAKFPRIIPILTLAIPVLTNTILLLSLVALLLFVRNLVLTLRDDEVRRSLANLSMTARLLLLIGGTPVDAKKALEKAEIPMIEIKNGEISVCRRLHNLMFSEENERRERVRSLIDHGYRVIWVMVGLPMIPLMEMGLLLSVVWGDFLLILMLFFRKFFLA